YSSEIADRPRGRGRAIRMIVKGLNRNDSTVAVSNQGAENRSKFLVTLSWPATVGVIHVNVPNVSSRKPVVNYLCNWNSFRLASGTRVDHSTNGRTANGFHHAYSFAHGVDEVRVTRRERLDTIEHLRRFSRICHRSEAVASAQPSVRDIVARWNSALGGRSMD